MRSYNIANVFLLVSTTRLGTHHVCIAMKQPKNCSATALAMIFLDVYASSMMCLEWSKLTLSEKEGQIWCPLSQSRRHGVEGLTKCRPLGRNFFCTTTVATIAGFNQQDMLVLYIVSSKRRDQRWRGYGKRRKLTKVKRIKALLWSTAQTSGMQNTLAIHYANLTTTRGNYTCTILLIFYPTQWDFLVAKNVALELP